MIDNRIEKYPAFSNLFSAIPFQPRSIDEENGCLTANNRPCPLCGRDVDNYIYDDDFGCYLCAYDYYKMYWNPEVILETDHFEADHFLPGIDRKLLYEFIAMISQKKESDKFGQLTIIEVE